MKTPSQKLLEKFGLKEPEIKPAATHEDRWYDARRIYVQLDGRYAGTIDVKSKPELEAIGS
jgi:hypothetical protein